MDVSEMVKVLFIILVNLLLVYCFNAVANYGPFNLAMKKVTACKGPKRKSCVINKAAIINETILIYDMDVLENMKDLQGNLFATSEPKQTVRLQMKKLCDHPFWMPFMSKFVNITNNCVILKGKYHSEINAQETARKYYGGSFVYGKWTFRSVYFNNECNFGCTSIVMSLTPAR